MNHQSISPPAVVHSSFKLGGITFTDTTITQLSSSKLVLGDTPDTHSGRKSHQQGEKCVPDKTGVAPMTRWNTGTNCPAELPAGDTHQPARRGGRGLPRRDTDLCAERGSSMCNFTVRNSSSACSIDLLSSVSMLCRTVYVCFTVNTSTMSMSENVHVFLCICSVVFTFHHVIAGSIRSSMCDLHQQGEMTGMAPMTRWNTGTNCPTELPAGDTHQPATRDGGGLPCRDTDLCAEKGSSVCNFTVGNSSSACSTVLCSSVSVLCRTVFVCFTMNTSIVSMTGNVHVLLCIGSVVFTFHHVIAGHSL